MKNFILKHKISLMLIISGFLTSLPLIITEIGFLQWISIMPLAYALVSVAEDESVKLCRFYGMGVLFFAVYYSVSFHWFFYMYPLDFAGLSNAASFAVVLVACFGLGLFQAVQSAFVFLIFGFILRTEAVRKHKIIIPFAAASLWTIAEWWQTFGWWGVPWARLGLGQIDFTMLVRSCAVFGSYFVTFIIVAVNFCLAMVLRNKGKHKICASLALMLFCINLALGLTVTLTYQQDGENIKVAAIQGNVPSSEKWDQNSKFKTLEIYKELTEQAASDGAEMVVWPETALPYVLFDSSELSQFVCDLARDNSVTIIVSAFTKDEESGLRYNSIIEVRPDGTFGEEVYSKQRLVPFGEFVPMRSLVTFIFPPLANIGMLEDDLLPGDDSVVIKSDVGNVGCGICFDSIYEGLMIDSVRNGAEIIVIATNDSWFSDSAALDMHNSQARLRAIENGRYVVRSANTGISSIIDTRGNVKQELGALERGYVISEVEMRTDSTPYSVIGNLFVYMCMAFIMLLAVVKVFEKGNINFIKKT